MRRILLQIASALVALMLAGCAADSGTSGGTSAGTSGGTSGASWTFTALDHVGAARSKLLIEVDHVVGHAPGGETLSRIDKQLSQLVVGGYLAKPGGVTVALDETDIAPGGADKVWTFKELEALALKHRSRPVAADTSGIHVLYVDGKYQDDTDQGYVLGFAYGGSWIVMLKDNVERSCENSALLKTPLLGALAGQVCEVTEARVLLHELGHVFGLVDNGLPMQSDHRDKAHGKHDSNDECLMFWLNETQAAVDVVAERFKGGDESVGDFDAACLADLKAAASR